MVYFYGIIVFLNRIDYYPIYIWVLNFLCSDVVTAASPREKVQLGSGTVI